jgi:hypothetical protein
LHPQLVNELLEAAFALQAEPAKPLSRMAIHQVREKVGIGRLLGDLLSMGRSL